MDNPDQLTVGQLKVELDILERFMETTGYRAYVEELKMTKESIHNQIFQPVGDSLGSILNREQEIGKEQILDDHIMWFDCWKDALKEQIAARAVVTTQN